MPNRAHIKESKSAKDIPKCANEKRQNKYGMLQILLNHSNFIRSVKQGEKSHSKTTEKQQNYFNYICLTMWKPFGDSKVLVSSSFFNMYGMESSHFNAKRGQRDTTLS